MKSPRLPYGLDWYGLLSFLVPLAGYLFTLAPSVTFFDSGEFMTAIHSLGSAHSPGYPLFILYAKVFTWLPFGSSAYRVNVATAVSAALACFIVYLVVRHLVASLGRAGGATLHLQGGAALAAALSFAFSHRLWLQSNHDKPYPLLAFMVGLMLLLILLWRDGFLDGDENWGHLYLVAFLAGLASGAHQLVILCIPLYVWLVFSALPSPLRHLREFFISAGFALSGLAVHLYLPLRAMRQPLQNWGDARTLENFLWHLLRRGYPVERPERDLSLFWEQLNAFSLPRELTFLGVVFLLVALSAYARPLRHFLVASLLSLLTFLAVVAGYFNTPADMIFLTEEFFTPLYLLASVLVGVGLYRCLEGVRSLLRSHDVRSSLVTCSLVLLATLLPFHLFCLNLWPNFQRHNHLAHDYAVNSLRSAPYGALFLTWGDSGAFPLWYLQGVERYREDVILLHIPHLAFPWYRNEFPGLFESSSLRRSVPGQLSSEELVEIVLNETATGRPVVVDYSTRHSLGFQGHALRQRGISYLVEAGEGGVSGVPVPVWQWYTLRGVQSPMFPLDLDTRKAVMIYAYASMEGAELYVRGNRPLEARHEMERALAIAPALRGEAERVVSSGGD